ncbi:MAG: hypothetical protein ACR2MG_05555 [Pyrinomonadaceae bacterium]
MKKRIQGQESSKRFILILMILPTLLVINSAINITAQTKPDSSLRNRVDLFYENFSKGRYEKMWAMTSKNFREKNDNDKKGYVKGLEGFKGVRMKMNIKDIERANKKAILTLERCLWAEEKQQWFCETIAEHWIFEKGKWFLDII